ncbi:reverse transcriptase domain-containing protein, partial [Tanacetum coccineum]
MLVHLLCMVKFRSSVTFSLFYTFESEETKGKEWSQGLEEPMSDEVLREMCDKNYHQLLPLIAEKMQKEKEQKDKLNAVKARLNLWYSRSPSPHASVFKRLKKNRSPSPRPRPRKEGGVFNRLGRKEPATSARPDSCQRSPRTKRNEVKARRRQQKGTQSRTTSQYSKSKDSEGGHWKSKSRRQRSNTYEDDLSQPWHVRKKPFHTSDRNLSPEELDARSPEFGFGKLPKESIDSYKDYGKRLGGKQSSAKSSIFKARMEIHHIKQCDGESTEMTAWKISSPGSQADMTGRPRTLRNTLLNIREGYSPVRQKKRGQAPERNKVIQEEVEKLVDAGIMKEVHYHSWLSNPVMVKKHDGTWRSGVGGGGGKLSKIILNTLAPKIVIILTPVNRLEGGIPLWIKQTRSSACHLRDAARTSIPFFKTLKNCTKKSDFQWTPEAEEAFKQMKKLIAELPTLTAPREREELIIYLAAAKEAISAVLMTDREGRQIPVYFVSRTLRGPEVNYTPMEKLVLALLSASKRLKRYFQAHTVVVITNQPIKQLLSNSEISGRMLKWKFELEGYDIQYRPRTAIKGQILADFIVERPEEESPDELMAEPEVLPEPWTLFTDGSSCVDGSGAGLILINPEGAEFTYAMRFRFEATNNEAEYEALIAGLRIAEQMGVKNLQANVDSRLVANQVNGFYTAKESGMVQYLNKVKTLAKSFKEFSIKQIPRSENKKADALSKIASTSFAHLNKQVLVEELKEKSINEKEILDVVEEEGNTWMTPICEYLTKEILPEDTKKARAVRRKAVRYMRGRAACIPALDLNFVDACTSAKYMWKRVERLMRRNIQNKVDKETRFTNKFDPFIAEPGEALVSVYNRFAQLMNNLERNDMHFLIVTINTKFLNYLQPEWLKYVTQLRLAKRLTVDTFDDLFDYLQQFEKLVNVSRAKKLEKSHDPLALVAHTGSSSRNTS